MADPKNIADCRPLDTSQPPSPTFAKDGVVGNSNIQNNTYVPPQYCKGTLDYSTSACAEGDSNYMAALMAEALNAAGGPVNLFPLLGVHNQGSLLDQAQGGYPLSSGTPSGYNVADAFNSNVEAWRSVVTGSAVTSTPAYLGYNFGTKKAWEAIGPAQERYFPTAPLRKQISTIKIKQSADPTMRAIQLRVEASDDGVQWTRIDVVNVPSTDQLVTIAVRSSAPFSMWRLVPTFFSGVVANAPWEVVELHLLESTQLTLDTIEDFVLLENRARAYCRSSILLKCSYDLLDVQSELARFGITLPQTYIFTCSFADMVQNLGRPVVVGDVVELPGEIQYDANLRPVRKWLEVTDTGWSTEGYTPNWKPNLFRFYAQPINPSIEHKDLLGIPGQVNSTQSDASVVEDGYLQNQLGFETSTVFEQIAADSTPQTGSDPQDIQSGMSLLGQPGSYDGRDLYAQDALPPDGASYTVGDALPNPTTISDGHYHRQTYTNVNASIRPPDRLLLWNATKQRWKVVEVNTRGVPESHKKTISSILSSSTKKDLDSRI